MKWIVYIILLIALIPIVYATWYVNETIPLTTMCINSTNEIYTPAYANVSIRYCENNTLIIDNGEMSDTGNNWWNYSFNTTLAETYCFEVECCNSSGYCFVDNGGFIVLNQTARVSEVHNMVSGIGWQVGIPLLLLAVIWVFFQFAKSLDTDNKWMQPLITLFTVMGVIFVVVLLKIGIEIAGQQSITGLTNTMNLAFTVVLYVLPFVVAFFVIYYVYNLLMTFRLKKRENG